MTINLSSLTASESYMLIREGSVTCEGLIRACLDRIEAREPLVHAWVHMDADAAIKRAKALDHAGVQGPLHGIPVAVKDIVSVAGMPVRYGSCIYENNAAAVDAACVVQLRNAGAVLVGKSSTTEFAYFQPSATANPINILHTPGGSSSGTAAAVADGMVPVGIGSQTAGSLIRPAAYCGIFGFKPTYARENLSGIKSLAPSLDTIGWVGRSIDDVELLRSVFCSESFRPIEPFEGRPRIGFTFMPEWDAVEPYAQRSFEDTLGQLGAVADLVEVPAGVFDGLADIQKAIMAYEAARSLAWEYDSHRSRMSDAICELISHGAQIPYSTYVRAQSAAARRIAGISRVFDDLDGIIAPSATGVAPLGLHATGDPVMSRSFTLLGLPNLTVPCGRGPDGLPLGVQIVCAKDRDRETLQLGAFPDARVGTRSGR